MTGSWTVRMVRGHLLDAVRWAQATAGPVGPSSARSSMPEPAFSLWDRIAEEWDWTLPADEVKAGRRLMLRPDRVTQLEQVIEWPWRYLPSYPGPARVLRVWLRCRVHHKPFTDAVAARGWSRSTAYWGRDRALSLISAGLDVDGVAPF